LQVRLRDKEGRKPSDLAETEDIKRILEFEEHNLEGEIMIILQPADQKTENVTHNTQN